MGRAELIARLRLQGIRPRRSMGQNFLVDDDACRRIARAATEGTESVVEIGAGAGSLTEHLLDECEDVVAVEKDRRMLEILRREFEPRGLRVMEGDAVEMNFSSLADTTGHKPAIAGNLPYNAAAPILFNLLSHRRSLGRWVLMFQREMAERIAARAGERKQGVIGLLVQSQMKVQRLFNLGPGAFYPRPKVQSTVLEFVPRQQPLVPEHLERRFATLVKAAFGTRRKQISNSLAPLFGSRDRLLRCLRAAGIDPKARPEQLGIEQFCKLAKESLVP
ncbi:MAG: ribosomal RNA small subunit methyltransferase A [Deltaproteobacteria bacterium]|nr:MAG: ribosomal RNA small subunit methyltransferase A [Deltaproteobacteria bacterium]